MSELIAHRGAHDVFTENTIDAFSRALDVGFQGVELDVHVTADGIPVVNHDETVIAPKVALSIRGTYFQTLHDAAPLIPRLADVLGILSGRAVAYVEVKQRDAASEIAKSIRESSCECAVHSFDHEVPRRIKALLPKLRTGILQTSRLVDSAHALRAAEADDLWQWHELIDAPLVAEISAAGGRVIAWTANKPSEWRVFKHLGVAGICTDLLPGEVSQ